MTAGAAAVSAMLGLIKKGAVPGVDASDFDPEEIVITAPKRDKGLDESRKPLTATEFYNELGSGLGQNLDKIFGTNGTFGKIGSKLGDALEGAGKGAFVAGAANALGIEMNSTGAQIGGAAGSFLPIPGGEYIGAIVGGILPTLFGSVAQGGATVTGGGDGFSVNVSEAFGGNKAAEQFASSAADSIGGSITRIADALGGKVGNFAVTIGRYKDDIRVNTTGGQTLGGVKKSRRDGLGIVNFDEDEQAAIAFAIADAIQDGAIQGITAVQQRLLQKGGDLDAQLNKAIAVGNIPRRLKQLKDPVGFAIDELNREFERLIAYLKEGGASAADFAEAEELYNLERQRALEQATNAAKSTIQAFIDDLLGGSQSPLNRRTVYENAREQLDRFTSDIQAGKTVDENALLDAARNFQEASRALYGSSGSFFDDFNFLIGLLQQAQSNFDSSASTDDPNGRTDLPPSPFDDPAIRAIMDGSNATVEDYSVEEFAQIVTIKSPNAERAISFRLASQSCQADHRPPMLMARSLPQHRPRHWPPCAGRQSCPPPGSGRSSRDSATNRRPNREC